MPGPAKASRSPSFRSLGSSLGRSRLGPENPFRRRDCSKSVLPLSSTLPNMLKKRVLLSFGEFHSASKRATRDVREQRRVGGVRTVAATAGEQFAGSQFEV